jgi:hypothetical protein
MGLRPTERKRVWPKLLGAIAWESSDHDWRKLCAEKAHELKQRSEAFKDAMANQNAEAASIDRAVRNDVVIPALDPILYPGSQSSANMYGTIGAHRYNASILCSQ